MTTFIGQLQSHPIVLIFVLLLFSFSALWLLVTARQGRNYVLKTVEDRRGTHSEELIVMVHGLRGSPKSMEGVRKAVREVKPEADIVIFDFGNQLFSNGDLFRIAQEMDDQLEELQASRRYSRILLLGFSLGALLVRKAYVYGYGHVEDAPTVGANAAVLREPRQWVQRVSRFVLLAGMNRGWTLEKQTDSSSSRSRWQLYIGWVAARLTGTGLLIRHAMRGEPFVANLRLQWLHVMRDLEAKGTARPRVLQLLGDQDDQVSKDDSRDINVSRDFIWVTVHNTDHEQILRVGDTGTALERKRKIQMAFGDDRSMEELKRTNPILARDEDTAVTTVVFVLHGIRDMGEWTSEFEEPLQKAYLKKHQAGEKIHIHRASYGFFAMGPFLIPASRRKKVRWFMDQVTELTARFPNLKEIHFIGHSNGTYVLASALQNYQTLKLGHAALAGSVIRRSYPWSQFTGRIKKVRNYVASRDIVVGFFPRLFELPFFSLINPDIGSAGFNGFEDDFARPLETQFVSGGHGAALVKENVPSIVDFIVNGTKIDAESICTQERSQMLQLLSNACWLVWLGLAAIIVTGGLAVHRGAVLLSSHIPWLPHPQVLIPGAYLAAVCYLIITI